MERTSRDPQTFAIIGSAMAVHTELGCGFLESVYRRALAAELELRRIAFRTEVPYPVAYRGRPLELHYRADIVCFGAVVVEVKAMKSLGPIEDAQVINYLRVSRLDRALLLNFGTPRLEYRRFALTQHKAGSL
jgi:GxxExxY protein